MIICAAIQVRFERNGRKVETVIHGLRHANCWETMAALGMPGEHTEVEGFIDDKNRMECRSERWTRSSTQSASSAGIMNSLVL